MKKIRKGDRVSVITGKDKGKSGSVLSCGRHDHIIVEGINLVKKHCKPNPSKNQPGGVLDKEMPIHSSNVHIFNI